MLHLRKTASAVRYHLLRASTTRERLTTGYWRTSFHQGVDPHDHVVEEFLVEIMDVDPAIRRGIISVTKGGLFEEGTHGNQPS